VHEQAAALHRFWFGELSPAGLPDPATRVRWFRGGSGFDRQCARSFGPLIEQALAGGLSEWLAEPGSSLALVLLLDQLPRNVYRGTARAFAGDRRALEIATAMTEAGDDATLRPVERSFLYLPFEHAEDREVQERSVALFRQLREAAPPGGEALFGDGLHWAERHRAAIQRFGRFPARNPALGRQTTPAEAAFLAEHPSGF
jgi:uncharacterized protein (DUF924 family)